MSYKKNEKKTNYKGVKVKSIQLKVIGADKMSTSVSGLEPCLFWTPQTQAYPSRLTPNTPPRNTTRWPCPAPGV